MGPHVDQAGAYCSSWGLGLRLCLQAVHTLFSLIVEALVQLEAMGVREPAAPIPELLEGTSSRRKVSYSIAARLARRVSLADN